MDKLYKDGYFLTRVDDQYYCIDFANRTIVNMNNYGLYVKRLQPRRAQKRQDQRQHISGPGVGRAIDKVAKQRGGSNDSNREWEVGSRGYDCIWDLNYNPVRQCIELELEHHLDDEKLALLSSQITLPVDYDGEGVNGSMFVICPW